MFRKLTISTDGGARGNPGPAACAYVIAETDQTGARFLGFGTNNEAEYQGVILALGNLGDPENLGDLRFLLDSLLVVNQLNGLWKIKEPRLQELSLAIKVAEQSLREKNPSLMISYTHIPRQKNFLADRLVNQILDEALRGKSFPLQ